MDVPRKNQKKPKLAKNASSVAPTPLLPAPSPPSDHIRLLSRTPLLPHFSCNYVTPLSTPSCAHHCQAPPTHQNTQIVGEKRKFTLEQCGYLLGLTRTMDEDLSFFISCRQALDKGLELYPSQKKQYLQDVPPLCNMYYLDDFAHQLLCLTFHFVAHFGREPDYWRSDIAEKISLFVPEPIRLCFSPTMAKEINQLIQQLDLTFTEAMQQVRHSKTSPKLIEATASSDLAALSRKKNPSLSDMEIEAISSLMSVGDARSPPSTPLASSPSLSSQSPSLSSSSSSLNTSSSSPSSPKPSPPTSSTSTSQAQKSTRATFTVSPPVALSPSSLSLNTLSSSPSSPPPASPSLASLLSSYIAEKMPSAQDEKYARLISTLSKQEQTVSTPLLPTLARSPIALEPCTTLSQHRDTTLAVSL